MRTVASRVLPALIAAGLWWPASALHADVEVDWGAQYRPRLEVDNKQLAPGTAGDVRASHRARLRLDLAADSWLIRAEPQHVLTWGSAPTTRELGTGTLDFHQAYAEGRFVDGQFRARVGRQEMVLDDSRLLGNIDWLQQGQSFDGLRFAWSEADLDLAVDIGGAMIHEGGVRDEMLLWLNPVWSPEGLRLSGLTVAQVAGERPSGERDFRRFTFGGRALWTHAESGFFADLSAYGQTGAYARGVTDMRVAAWMTGTRLGVRNTAAGSVQAGFDWLSGDDNPADTTVHVFDTLYATNHKWYGTMDYFLNIPLHTAGRGLVDAVLDWDLPAWRVLSPNLALHGFWTAVPTAGGERLLGGEADLTLKVDLPGAASLIGGYSLFLSGDAMVDIGRAAASGEPGQWAWLQLNLQL